MVVKQFYMSSEVLWPVMPASIDSNRVVDVKRCCVYCGGCLYILTSPIADDLRFGLSLWQLNHFKPFNSRFCYMVKPHEQLVLVSSTPHSASTPNLSTS